MGDVPEALPLDSAKGMESPWIPMANVAIQFG